MSRFYLSLLLLVTIALFTASAHTAQAQAVKWLSGYPEAKDAPRFFPNGSVLVFGEFDNTLGTPTTAQFVYVPQSGGTPARVDLNFDNITKRFGKTNPATGAVNPVKISVPKGQWNVRVEMWFSKANPTPPPPKTVTVAETATVAIEIK